MQRIMIGVMMCSMSTMVGCAIDPTPGESKTEQDSSAPPITLVQVAQVASSNVPNGELISANQISTALDEGGAILRVWTNELGIGGNPVATMNGAVLPSSALLATFNICQNFSGSLEFTCAAGESIVGFQKIWSLNGSQSGRFTYQNTSVNSPFNTLSTAINIL